MLGSAGWPVLVCGLGGGVGGWGGLGVALSLRLRGRGAARVGGRGGVVLVSAGSAGSAGFLLGIRLCLGTFPVRAWERYPLKLGNVPHTIQKP